MITVAGVEIDNDHPDVAGIKSVKDLERLNIFEHLYKDEQKKAYQELFDHIKPDKKEENKT